MLLATKEHIKSVEIPLASSFNCLFSLFAPKDSNCSYSHTFVLYLLYLINLEGKLEVRMQFYTCCVRFCLKSVALVVDFVSTVCLSREWGWLLQYG